MKLRSSIKLFFKLTLFLPVLSGCGQKGPLYLPGEAPPPSDPNIMEQYTANAG